MVSKKHRNPISKSVNVEHSKLWDNSKDDHNYRDKTAVQFILIGFGEKFSKGVKIDLFDKPFRVKKHACVVTVFVYSQYIRVHTV